MRVKIPITAFRADGLDDAMLLHERGIEATVAIRFATLAGKPGALRAQAEQFATRADPESGFENTKAERRACAVAAYKIFAALGESA